MTLLPFKIMEMHNTLLM